MFPVSKGMRQGSVLSPVLFNFFINELLQNLKASEYGVSILDKHFSACAYADDVTVFSATVPGLQRLIDQCATYAKEWRFNFGIEKSQCLVIDKPLLKCEPRWYLSSQQMKVSSELDILGVTFSSKENTISM